jgi:hypothetical protein
MRSEQVRLLVGDFPWDGKIHSAGEMVTLPEHDASLLVQQGRATWTHRVRVLRPIFDGRATHAAGEVVEVSREQAIGFWESGRVEPLDPQRLGDLPQRPSAPVEAPDPYPDDPRVGVEIRKPAFFGARSYTKGEHAQVPERVAVCWCHNGLARIERGEGFSARGQAYLRALGAHQSALFHHEPRY